jgi:hypothetical protein
MTLLFRYHHSPKNIFNYLFYSLYISAYHPDAIIVHAAQPVPNHCLPMMTAGLYGCGVMLTHQDTTAGHMRP